MNIKFALLCFLVIFLSILVSPPKSNSTNLYLQTDIDLSTINDPYESNETMAIFNNKILQIPDLSYLDINPNVLGDSNSSKRIEVDLGQQKLFAYEDNRKVFEFSISSGKWNSTPNGTFTIWAKVKKQKMSGGSKENNSYYYLPNVPNILFFYNDNVPKKLGYSIHGTYWHNSFGQPMSHGCINMRTDESNLIYSFADFDTPIIITGKYQ